MAINGQLGRLTEAVDSLKEQAKERDRKTEEAARHVDQKFESVLKEIRQVAMDVHAAKAGGKTLLWVIGVVGALFGILIAAYYQGKFAPQPSPPSAPAQSQAPAAK